MIADFPGTTMRDSSNTPPWQLTARDVMHVEILTVSRSTPLSEIERLLGEHRIGGVPVTDEAGHVVGMVSVRDLLEHYSEDPDARPRRGNGSYHVDSEELDEDIDAYEVPAEAEETAGDIMNADLHHVPPEMPLPQVAALMQEQRIHRVMVRDAERYVGLISTFDLLGALAAAGDR